MRSGIVADKSTLLRIESISFPSGTGKRISDFPFRELEFQGRPRNSYHQRTPQSISTEFQVGERVNQPIIRGCVPVRPWNSAMGASLEFT
jgi:hypothetical protein